jgi:pyruvate dehydrogenase E1 component beta subunit
VLRVAGKDTPVPYAKELEDFHLPQVADIVDAVRAVTK